eukprot:403373790
MADPFRRNYGAGNDYSNTSNNRIKDTLAKAQSILLDDPFQNDGLSSGFGGGAGRDRDIGYGSGLPPTVSVNRHSSQPPIMNQGYGGGSGFGIGIAKSNYTQSDDGESNFDTHSQFQNRRQQQWGKQPGQDNMGGGYGDEFSAYKNPGNDLAGLTEIGTVNAPGSRRGSFRAPMNDTESRGNRNSDSKERMREPQGSAQNIGGFGYGGLPRPTTGGYENTSLGLKRPQTSADQPTGFVSGQFTLSGQGAPGNNMRTGNLYSEVASSYKDDDAMSYMGQSEYGGMSQIGGGGQAFGGRAIGTGYSGAGASALGGLDSAIPTLEINKAASNIPSRRMAAKTAGGNDSSTQPPPRPNLAQAKSTNFGIFLQDDASKLPPSSQNQPRRQTTTIGGGGSSLAVGGNNTAQSSIVTGGDRDRSYSPPKRNENDFQNIGFGRPATGQPRAAGGTMNTSLGTNQDNNSQGRRDNSILGGTASVSNAGGNTVTGAAGGIGLGQGFGSSLKISEDIMVRGSQTNLNANIIAGGGLGLGLGGGIAGSGLGLGLGLDSFDKGIRLGSQLNQEQIDKQEKEAFARKKKLEDIERLEEELRAERLKTKKQQLDADSSQEDLKEKNKKDLESIEESQKLTLDLLLQEKEKTMETLQEAIAREKQKMEVLHQADLESKERQHQNQLEQQRRQLEKETLHLEEQLSQQQELKEALEKVQQRTVDLSDLVQSGLKSREDEIKRREQEMLRKERQLIDEEEIEIAMEEKRLEEEERKLQKMRDDLQKNKSTFNTEIDRLRDQRRLQRDQNDLDLKKQKQDERHTKELLDIEKSKLDTEDEKRKTKKRIAEMEMQNKENECENLKNRLQKERDDFESEVKERLLREIQIIQIKVEERREFLSQKEGELRKKFRYLEKKREIIKGDWEDYYNKVEIFDIEKREFDEWAKKVKETSIRLVEERDRVIVEKQSYDFEREKLEKWKMDLDLQRSILQSDFIRAEELEHELDHREKMLQMLKFNREQAQTGINVPPYSSCPALKVDPRAFVLNQQLVNQQNCNHGQRSFVLDQDPMAMNPQMYQEPQYFYPQQQMQDQSYGSVQVQQQDPIAQVLPEPRKKFDYNNYVQELQQKLGSEQVFKQRQSFNQYMAGQVDNFRKDLSQVTEGHNEISMSNMHAYRQGARPDAALGGGYGTDSTFINNQQMNTSKSNNVSAMNNSNNIMGMARDNQSLRDQIQARLGNAQLSESKHHYESSGVEEQEQEYQEDSNDQLQNDDGGMDSGSEY